MHKNSIWLFDKERDTVQKVDPIKGVCENYGQTRYFENTGHEFGKFRRQHRLKVIYRAFRKQSAES
jgi:hypothetical protein